ncbi:MAG: hypothetical protein QM778_06420 [Myxococcales bacterium]
MRTISWIFGLIALATLPFAFSPLGAASDEPSQPRLYALNGGVIDFKDAAMFCDTGELDGKLGKFVAGAYLVRHPKGTSGAS